MAPHTRAHAARPRAAPRHLRAARLLALLVLAGTAAPALAVNQPIPSSRTYTIKEGEVFGPIDPIDGDYVLGGEVPTLTLVAAGTPCDTGTLVVNTAVTPRTFTWTPPDADFNTEGTTCTFAVDFV
jgi:hypothetical protein